MWGERGHRDRREKSRHRVGKRQRGRGDRQTARQTERRKRQTEFVTHWGLTSCGPHGVICEEDKHRDRHEDKETDRDRQSLLHEP